MQIFDPEKEGYLFTKLGSPMRWVVWPSNGGRAISFHTATIEPGKEMLRHVHPISEDMIFVAKGEGQVLTDSGDDAIREGQVIWVQAGERHGFRNTGGGVLYLVGSQAPCDLDIYRLDDFSFSQGRQP